MKNTYIIAEIAQTHEGSYGNAIRFIDSVAAAGADAIKFQLHLSECESSPDDKFRTGFDFYDLTRTQYWERTSFTYEQWVSLRDYATDKGLDFILSTFSLEGLLVIKKLNLPFLKIGSAEVMDSKFIEKAFELFDKIIVSTGLINSIELKSTIDNVDKSKIFSILQCTTNYPTELKEIGLNQITVIREELKVNTGLSDHSSSIYPSIAAATLGANVIEVHVAFSREQYGPDVKASITTTELKELVNAIRMIDLIMNNPTDKSHLEPSVIENRKLFSKSLYYSKDLRVGDVLKTEDIRILKPGGGEPSSSIDQFLGRKLTKNVDKNNLLKSEDFT